MIKNIQLKIKQVGKFDVDTFEELECLINGDLKLKLK